MSDNLSIPADWDDADYLERHPDVANAVARQQFPNGWQHYLEHGHTERRPGGTFSAATMLTRKCLDPWRYLEISPDQGLKPCCDIPPIASWAPEGMPPDRLRNADAFRVLREQLLSACLPATCRACHSRPLVPVEELRAELHREYGVASDDEMLTARPLRELRLEITTKCNLRCVYCPVSQPGYNAIEMSTASFPPIISLVGELPRDTQILVNGHGETTFHPHWLSLCKAIVDLGFRPGIITNLARPLKDDEAACLAGFGTIQVSLDTIEPGLLCSLRRRVKLSTIVANIRKIRAAARILRQAPPQFSISCGVYDANYALLERGGLFAIALGMRAVTFWQLVKYDDLPDALNVYPVASLPVNRIADAVAHLERTLHLLHRAGLRTEVAGGFLDEWRERVNQQRSRRADTARA